MLAKSDSDVASQPESSPTTSSPYRPVPGPMYYVQSPSRDSSHDGEKTTNSFHSTPVISPVGSPPHDSHSDSSLGRKSRESSSTRLSRSTKPAGGKVKGSGGGSVRGKKGRRRNELDQFDAIWEEEEEFLLGDEGDDEHRGSVSKRTWYFIGFLVAFFVLFSFFSLVLWGASRNQKPVITIKSVRFAVFDVHSGMDYTGVATAMASTNATIRLVYQNRGTFFGVHVTSTPLQLFYEQIVIATGTIEKFYESRKSRRNIEVILNGTNIPLYGGNYNLNTKNGVPLTPVPVTLTFKVRSRAYVLGRLVKSKFYKSISCSLVMDPKKMNMAISLRNSCTYQ